MMPAEVVDVPLCHFLFKAIGDILKDIYHDLKFILNADTDDVTLQYADKALRQLDSITKNFLFPKEDFKKRIRVLQAPSELK